MEDFIEEQVETATQEIFYDGLNMNNIRKTIMHCVTIILLHQQESEKYDGD